MRRRRFTGDTLVIATHNAGKVPEIAGVLKSHVQHFPTAGDLGLLEPVETEDSFAGNAILKAKAAALASQLPALADDSGLVVKALDGQPGVHSARWATQPDGRRDFSAAMQRVLYELEDKLDRSAAFVCVLALAWPDGHVETAEGVVEGAIAEAPRGLGGFGYDGIFVAAGQYMTFGENPSLKGKLSHRSQALSQLLEKFF